MKTAFAKIEEAKVFAKIDLRSACWQIELDKESKAMIYTAKSLFEFNLMV